MFFVFFFSFFFRKIVLTSLVNQFQTFHFFEQLFAHLGGTPCHNHTGPFQCIDFVLSTALTTGNDGAGMTHSAAGRSGQTSNERHHRLGFDALRSILKLILIASTVCKFYSPNCVPSSRRRPFLRRYHQFHRSKWCLSFRGPSRKFLSNRWSWYRWRDHHRCQRKGFDQGQPG